MKLMYRLLLSVLTVGALAHAEGSKEDFNVRTFVLGLPLGLFDLRFDYRLTDHWVMGTKLYLWDYNFGDLKINSAGLGVNGIYYFTPVFLDSWYVDFGGQFSSLRVDSKNGADRTELTKVSNVGVQVLGGYHWFWDPINFNLGAGLITNSAGKIQVKDSVGRVIRQNTLPAVGLTGDASVGWTF